MKQKKKLTVPQLVAASLMAAVLCVTAPLTVQLGPIPITLATLVLYLTVTLLGLKLSLAACAVYLLLGFAGMPVFTGWTGGLYKLAGPTGGYLVGYLPLVLIAGLFAERFAFRPLSTAAGMILGTAALYALGTAWFVIQAGCTLSYALGVCVAPFLLVDLGKIAASLALGLPLRAQIKKAGLLP